jgi:hypothetical protein
VNDWVILRRLQRYFFLNPDKSGQGCSFYDISGPGMHHHRLRKTQDVAEGRMPELVRAGPGGGPDHDLQSASMRVSSPDNEIIVPF